MMTRDRMAEIIRQSGYKKGFVAAHMGINTQKLCDIIAGRRKISAEEYIAFCAFFKLLPDGTPMEG